MLRGETLELQRQLDEIAWLESFLRHCRGLSPPFRLTASRRRQHERASPTQFLQGWQRHVQFR